MFSRRIVINLILSLLVIAAGVAGMSGLARLRKPPSQKPATELSVVGVGLQVQPETVQITLSGYGTARAHQRTDLSAQVGGRLVQVNPALENGAWIEQGALLVEIDPSDYQTRIAQLQAETEAADSQIRQLEAQRENDEGLLQVVEKAYQLARQDYERIRKLALEDKVESRSRMDSAELAMVTQQEQLVRLKNQLALYPVQIRQQTARRDAVRAQMNQAQLDLARTQISAPFSGRIENKAVEAGQIVAPGTRLATLVDDAVMEISVPLEGQDVARWLDLGMNQDSQFWFTQWSNNPVTVVWTEWPELTWTGALSRVEKFDEQTRTMRLVVRVENPRGSQGEAAVPPPAGVAMSRDFPLTEGMFCAVKIPGRTVEAVYRLPDGAVEQNGQVLMVEDGRMRTRTVDVLRREGESVLVQSGLHPGEIVLTQQPSRVLDGLKVTLTEGAPPEATTDERTGGSRPVAPAEQAATTAPLPMARPGANP